MDNLIYLSYGQGPHIDELVYSVLSALHHLVGGSGGFRIVVYTDDSASFGDLPVHLELLSEKVLAEWAGPCDFNHRRKIFAIKNALEKFGDRLIYCDADTFFVKHPKKAFARVRPGHTLMHIGEYHLYDRCASSLANFFEGHDVLDLTGRRWNITPETAMFNAGVIGLHESDISLLDEVIHLTDQIYPDVRIPTIEQFAFSVCFHRYTKLRQSYDIIHHYWSPARRALFREQLSRVLHEPSISSYEERFRQLLPNRPSQIIKDRPFKSPCPRRLKDQIYVMFWGVANRTGILNPLKKIATAAGLKNSLKRA